MYRAEHNNERFKKGYSSQTNYSLHSIFFLSSSWMNEWCLKLLQTKAIWVKVKYWYHVLYNSVKMASSADRFFYLTEVWSYHILQHCLESYQVGFVFFCWNIVWKTLIDWTNMKLLYYYIRNAVKCNKKRIHCKNNRREK